MTSAQTLYRHSLALCLLLSVASVGSADDAAIERERAALRQQFMAATDSRTKRELFSKLRKLKLGGAPAAKTAAKAKSPERFAFLEQVFADAKDYKATLS